MTYVDGITTMLIGFVLVKGKWKKGNKFSNLKIQRKIILKKSCSITLSFRIRKWCKYFIFFLTLNLNHNHQLVNDNSAVILFSYRSHFWMIFNGLSLFNFFLSLKRLDLLEYQQIIRILAGPITCRVMINLPFENRS